MRIPRPAAAGLVRRDENLRTPQCRETDVLDEVAVVANQNADAKSIRDIEHREQGAAANRQMLKRVQFAMPLRVTVSRRDNRAVVEFS